MAWSLGEDTWKFAHLDAMQQGVKQTTNQSTEKKPNEGARKGEMAGDCNGMN